MAIGVTVLGIVRTATPGTDVSGRDLAEVRIQRAEDSAGQRLLCSSSERAQAGNADRVGSAVQEIGSFGRVGAGVGKIACVEFDGGEIDEDLHALPAWARVKLGKPLWRASRGHRCGRQTEDGRDRSRRSGI